MALPYAQEPVCVELGTTYRYKRSGAKRSLVEKSENFYYVPLIDNLEWILQNKEVYDEVCILSAKPRLSIIHICPYTKICIYTCRCLKSEQTPLTCYTTSVMASFLKSILCLVLINVLCN